MIYAEISSLAAFKTANRLSRASLAYAWGAGGGGLGLVTAAGYNLPQEEFKLRVEEA